MMMMVMMMMMMMVMMMTIPLCQFTGVGSSTEKGGRWAFKGREAGEQGTGGGRFCPPCPHPPHCSVISPALEFSCLLFHRSLPKLYLSDAEARHANNFS